MENIIAKTARRMTRWIIAGIGVWVPAALMTAGPANAHFQELIPSTESLGPGDGRVVSLTARFTHPFARGPVMEMEPPIRFGVQVGGKTRDLTRTLAKVAVNGKATYRADVPVAGPGDHVFFLEPAPYWEPAEGVMIIHYTKVVVDAFGAEDGWDASVGMPVEIDPLVRPYGLWTGNLFRGVVRKNGEPVPFATVEVEWRNDGSVTAPAGSFVTQVVKADAGGVFAYAMPRAGWWGFAALLEGDAPMRNPAGESVPVETGALIWVRTRDMQ